MLTSTTCACYCHTHARMQSRPALQHAHAHVFPTGMDECSSSPALHTCAASLQVATAAPRCPDQQLHLLLLLPQVLLLQVLAARHSTFASKTRGPGDSAL